MKQNIKVTIFAVILLCGTAICVQANYNIDEAMQAVNEALSENDCSRARKFYQTWKVLTNKTDGDIERRIAECPEQPSDQGVVINGVRWATRNVAAPGTFAEKPEDAGKFYRWNRKKAWAVTGSVIGWEKSIPTGADWDKFNDPSPTGWRVPTFDELKKLLDTYRVSNEWITVNGVSGRKFTDKTTGNSIFLPAARYRSGSTGAIYSVGCYGYYWCGTQGGSDFAFSLRFDSGNADWFGSSRGYGFSVRPVAE